MWDTYSIVGHFLKMYCWSCFKIWCYGIVWEATILQYTVEMGNIKYKKLYLLSHFTCIHPIFMPQSFLRNRLTSHYLWMHIILAYFLTALFACYVLYVLTACVHKWRKNQCNYGFSSSRVWHLTRYIPPSLTNATTVGREWEYDEKRMRNVSEGLWISARFSTG